MSSLVWEKPPDMEPMKEGGSETGQRLPLTKHGTLEPRILADFNPGHEIFQECLRRIHTGLQGAVVDGALLQVTRSRVWWLRLA